jgi:hypothetical protein
MSAIIYFLPALLILPLIILIKRILERDKRGILITFVPFLIAAIAFALYHYPIDNVLGHYSFGSIMFHGKVLNDVEITNQDDINKILKVINKHTFIRSATKTVEPQTFPGDDLLRLDMWDPKKGVIIHMYILEENTDKDLLQINELMLNVRDKEGLSKEVFDTVRNLKIKE